MHVQGLNRLFCIFLLKLRHGGHIGLNHKIVQCTSKTGVVLLLYMLYHTYFDYSLKTDEKVLITLVHVPAFNTLLCTIHLIYVLAALQSIAKEEQTYTCTMIWSQ